MLRPLSVSDLQGLTLGPSLSRFELLPQPIRYCIYKFLLSSKHTIVCHDEDERLGLRRPRAANYKGYNFDLKVFRINRNIHLESMEFFYYQNKFVSIRSNEPQWITTATAYLPVLSRKSSAGTLPYSLSVDLTIGEDSREPSSATEVNTIIAAYDLPVFVQRLRSSLLSIPLHQKVDVSLDLRDAPWGQEVYATAFLEPFLQLARVNSLKLAANVDQRLGDSLRSSMLEWPSIGPELLSELKAIRKHAEHLTQSNDPQAAKAAYQEGRDLLSVAERDAYSRDGMKRLGGPLLLADLLAESVSLDMNLLSLCFNHHTPVEDSFEQAMAIESRVLSTVDDLLPQYSTRRKARLYFELGSMHRRFANLRHAHQEGQTDVLTQLRKALLYYEKSQRLAPGDDSRYASYLHKVRDRIRYLEKEEYEKADLEKENMRYASLANESQSVGTASLRSGSLENWSLTNGSMRSMKLQNGRAVNGGVRNGLW